MRVLVDFAVSIAAIVLVLSAAPPGRALGQFNKEPIAKADQPPADDAKETRLSLVDVRTLRGKHSPTNNVVDMTAERGRAFEVTAEVEADLRKMGFSAAQIAAMKDASPDPLVPGRTLSSSDEERDAYMELMKKVVAKSGAKIEPVSSQHVTLWAAKDVQQKYLADIENVEKFLHTKCAEPIRSGLDKRTAHVVLLATRAEYEAWWHAMLELDEKLFEMKDEPGFTEQIRRDVVKWSGVQATDFSVTCTGEIGPEWTRRSVGYSVGYEYVWQLTERRSDALQTGFGNLTEAAVCGSPAYTGADFVYGKDRATDVVAQVDWGQLVKQRMTAGKASTVADLFKAEPITSFKSAQPIYAERWSFVGLLNKQPAKFGKLLSAIKDGDSNLAAIEKVYGWDEKELTRQWHLYRLSMPKMKAPAKGN